MSGEIIHSVNPANELGEGIVWDHRSQTLLWTDIHGKKLFRMQWYNFEVTETSVPERLCAFGLTENPEKLIAAFETGFAYFSPATGEIKWLHKTYDVDTPQIRLNDGRMGRDKRFWVGSIVEDDTAPKAKLYALSPNGALNVYRDKIAIANGLGFSPDGQYIYFTDTPNQQIEVSKLTEPLKWHPFATTETHAYPDGATVDKEGNLWSAEWGAGRVTAYRPDGTVILRYPIPATQPSCCTFAGPDLKYLCVTSARVGLSETQISENPKEGSMFILKTDFAGLPEVLFPEKTL